MLELIRVPFDATYFMEEHLLWGCSSFGGSDSSSARHLCLVTRLNRRFW